MNIALAQKRLLLWVILPAAVLYFGLRLYAQYRPVEIYVSRTAPIPAELAAGLHMKEHGIDPQVTVESRYEAASDRILTLDEVRRVRSAIAWSSAKPVFIDSVTIQSPTRVLARRTRGRVVLQYQLAKREGHWQVESMTRGRISPAPQ